MAPEDERLEVLRLDFRRCDLGGEGRSAAEDDVIRRHPGNRLGEDVALTPVSRSHPGTAKRQIGGDLEGADAGGTAGNDDRSAAVASRALILGGVCHAERAGEALDAGNIGHVAGGVRTRRNDDVGEDFLRVALRAGGAQAPAPIRHPLQGLDPRLKPNTAGEVEDRRIAPQIGVHLVPAGIDGRAGRMIKIREGGHHARGVGAHAAPGGAGGIGPVPLAAERGGRLEQDRLEAVFCEPARGYESGRAGTDDGYAWDFPLN